MTKARELADVIGTQSTTENVLQGRRNLIINGAMQVAQRGTSFTSNGYGIDRWKTYNSGGTATLSQQTFASGDSPEVGLDTYVRIVRSSPSNTYFFSQRVEDVRKSGGATLTLSFYAKASSATTIPCRITQEFGSGGSSGVNITAQDSNVTTSWQRFSLTFNMASLSGKTIGTGSFFEPVFDIPATTATIEITGVQLEVGSVATPFEHRSYGEELALCQRYYCHSHSPASPPNLNTYHYYGNSAMAVDFEDLAPTSLQYPVPMRASPSITYGRLYSYNGGVWKNITGVYTGNNGGGSISHDGGYSVGRPALFAWIADAEL
jgi:hypothetical protein